MARADRTRRSRRRKTRANRAESVTQRDETVIGHGRPTLSEKLLGGRLPVIATNETLDAPGVRHFDDTRLATGISVAQLVQQAEQWWTRIGARNFRGMRMSGVRSARSRLEKYRGPITLNPDDPNFLPSGLLNGMQWDHLSKAEKLQVCKAYHEIRYARPMRDSEATLLLPGPLVH